MASPEASLPGLQCGGPCHRVVLTPSWMSFTHIQKLYSMAHPKDKSTEVQSWGAPRAMATLVTANSRLDPSCAPSSTEPHRTCTLGLAGHPEAARGGGGAAEDLGDPGCEAGEGPERRSRYRRQVWGRSGAGLGAALASHGGAGQRALIPCRGQVNTDVRC